MTSRGRRDAKSSRVPKAEVIAISPPYRHVGLPLHALRAQSAELDQTVQADAGPYSYSKKTCERLPRRWTALRTVRRGRSCRRRAGQGQPMGCATLGHGDKGVGWAGCAHGWILHLPVRMCMQHLSHPRTNRPTRPASSRCPRQDGGDSWTSAPNLRRR